MSRPQTLTRGRTATKHCAGLDVSVKETAICIVDETGKIVREAKITTEPEAIVGLLMEAGFEYARIGLEAGPMSQWLVTDLLEAGLPVVCVETRHMKAVLKAQQVNKSDRNDARGIAQTTRRQEGDRRSGSAPRCHPAPDVD
jgi:transposase